MKHEALAMVYSVGKLKNYFLTNHFVFYIDHQALIYLVHQHVLSGWIARWMLLLQLVVSKPNRKHVMPDHLLGFEIGEEPLEVQDQFPNASLFMVHVQPFED